MPAAAMAASSRCRRAVAREMLSAIVPIFALRRLCRHISLRDVIRDLAPFAHVRIAPAAAACRAEDQTVARLHWHVGRLEEPPFTAVAPRQNRFVDGPRLAAVESPGRVLDAFAVH